MFSETEVMPSEDFIAKLRSKGEVWLADEDLLDCLDETVDKTTIASLT